MRSRFWIHVGIQSLLGAKERKSRRTLLVKDAKVVHSASHPEVRMDHDIKAFTESAARQNVGGRSCSGATRRMASTGGRMLASSAALG